jgi:signal transduction histidine kinase/ActR/RegA family two-component response regulator
MHAGDAFTAARQILIMHRLPRFAACWVGTTALWSLVLVTEGRIRPLLASLAIGLQCAVLAVAHHLCRSDRRGRRVPAVLVSASVLLGVSSTVLFAAARGSGDVLAFVLLTLYLSAALFFAWGWRAELVLWTPTVVAWLAAAPFLVFYVPAVELTTAIVIGTVLSFAIAEGTARSFRAAWKHRDAQARILRQLEVSRDAAEAATRAKDQFLSTVSHELRSPLNAILAWMHLLRRGPLDAERVAHAVDVVERNARLQARLIEDLLDVTRVAAGKLHLEMERLDVRELIGALVDTMRVAAEAKHVDLAIDVDSEPLLVRGDPMRLQQVLGNLVANAIKFTPKSGCVLVSARSAGGTAVIAVRDTGIGMTPEVVTRVFERFHQADSSIARRHGGLGLGLAIARHLVELHGGTIEAESAGRDLGSTFRVRLPLATRSRGAARGDGQPKLDAALPSLAGLRVMVVDDEVDAREFMTTLLSDYGASVTSAASAAEAMHELKDTLPDVVVSDLAMPDEDGFALIERLRRFEHERGMHMRAIAITGLAGPEHRMRAMHAGFDLHLTKPVEAAEVIAAVAGIRHPSDV